jgi:hypothetical protein
MRRPRTANDTVNWAARSRVQLAEQTQVLTAGPVQPGHQARARRAQVLTVLVVGVVGAIALWSRYEGAPSRTLVSSPSPVARSEPPPASVAPPERTPEPVATPEPVRTPIVVPPVAIFSATPPPPVTLPSNAPLPPPVPWRSITCGLPPPPPPPPSAFFRVVSIAGENPSYVAVLEFEGMTYIVNPGTMVPDEMSPAFEVKYIGPDRVDVFDSKTRRIVSRTLGF